MITAKLEIIDDFSKFERLKTYVKTIEPEYMVYDCETDGLIEKTCKLYGLGLCFNEDYAFYIVWRNQQGNKLWNKEQEQQIIDWFYTISSKTKGLGHNALYDILVLESNLGINITDFLYSDTLLLAHTINENDNLSLKPLGVKYLGPWADKAQQAMIDNIKLNGGKTTKENMEMFKCDTAILGEYCCHDVLLTLMLFKLFEKKLYEEGLEDLFYKEEVMELYRNVTIPMKLQGFPVDVPLFNQLNEDITRDINKLEEEIQQEVVQYVGKFTRDLLNSEVPIKNKGNLPKFVAEQLNIPLPINEKGSITLAKKAVELQKASNIKDSAFYDWLLSSDSTPPKELTKAISMAQKAMFFANNPGKYVFNLNSNDHLSYLLVTCLKYKPLDFTDGGKKGIKKPKMDEEFFDSIKTDDTMVQKLLDYKKLNKLKSTYIIGILDRQINGVIYTSLLQAGTTSGRYSSRNPNLQNLPRIKDEESGLSEAILKYVNSIRKGFISPPGFKVVNSDYAQLEVMCFADTSKEPALIEAIKQGRDIYSQVAIDITHMNEYSADKKASNYLKTHKPEVRVKYKPVVLGIVYGAEESRVSDMLSCDRAEAKEVIDNYLQAYPELKNYMQKTDYHVKKYGKIKSDFNRVRHLPEAQKLYSLYGNDLLNYRWAKKQGLIQERRIFKNLLNNSKNYPIQSKAASIVNRAMIATAKEFKINKIDGSIRLTCHDEITCIVREDQAEQAAKILQKCMETTNTLSVPLSAVPIISTNWGDAK